VPSKIKDPRLTAGPYLLVVTNRSTKGGTLPSEIWTTMRNGFVIDDGCLVAAGGVGPLAKLPRRFGCGKCQIVQKFLPNPLALASASVSLEGMLTG
jgi:hypothetical protein